MGEIHELFILVLSLVWCAGATPDSSPKSNFPAERTVHEQNGESITAFWRVHWQVLESTLLIFVFLGVRVFCSKQIRQIEMQTIRPWSQSEGPCLGNPSVSAKEYVFCSETSSGIAGGLDPVSVNLSWGV